MAKIYGIVATHSQAMWFEPCVLSPLLEGFSVFQGKNGTDVGGKQGVIFRNKRLYF